MHRSYPVKKGPITVGQLLKLERLERNLSQCGPNELAARAVLLQDLHGNIQAMIQQAKNQETLKRDPLSVFSTKKFDRPKNCKVAVSRMGIGGNDIEIEGAVSERDAAERALDEAGSYEFSDKDAEYSVQDVDIGEDTEETSEETSEETQD